MKKSSKIRIGIVLAIIACVVFLGVSVVLMLSGIKISHKLTDETRSMETLQQELDDIRLNETKVENKIKKLEEKMEISSKQQSENLTEQSVDSEGTIGEEQEAQE